MSDPTIEVLQVKLAELAIENGKLRNTINFQAMEMRDVATAVQMPVPAWNDKPPYWTMEFLAEFVALHVKALKAQRDVMQVQRDEFYVKLMDENDTSIPK